MRDLSDVNGSSNILTLCPVVNGLDSFGTFSRMPVISLRAGQLKFPGRYNGKHASDRRLFRAGAIEFHALAGQARCFLSLLSSAKKHALGQPEARRPSLAGRAYDFSVFLKRPHKSASGARHSKRRRFYAVTMPLRARFFPETSMGRIFAMFNH